MADVLAVTGAPKSWVSPEYCPVFPSSVSDSSSSLSGNSESLDEHSLQFSSDWHSRISSAEPVSIPHPDCPFLYHLPIGQTQDIHDITETMPRTRSFVSHAVSSQENLYFIPRRDGDHYGTEYGQNVSPDIPRSSMKSGLPNLGDGYCESYHGSFENYHEAFYPRNVDSRARLVHPISRAAHMVATNLSFLSVSEDTPSISSFETSNEQSRCGIFDPLSVYVPNTTGYSSNQSDLDLGSHKAHMEPHTSPCPKFTSSKNGAPWTTWNLNNEPDMWYPQGMTSEATEDMNWPALSPYEAAWPVNHPYMHTKQNRGSLPKSYGIPMPKTSHMSMTGASSSSNHDSFYSSIPRPTAIAVPPNQQSFPNNEYSSNPGAIYSDTETGSFSQLHPNRHSPSYVHSTTEESASPQPASEDQAAIEASLHYSDTRNAFLIECKRRGLSYKDIKRIGGFKEAESTLRGRFRTLTKAKDQRVRKPKWQDRDIKLLCDAVLVCSESPEAYASIVQLSVSMHQPPKVSWKKVAEYIWSHGGSYYFGNATCKKKWCEIHDIKL
ncbi:uncharacterized protein N7511_003872 [Penicillium nucicola]|uniref:uncharacterized protein n=1 Tax=Penicillium nucicola TaxID=1850975 RepID=UPI002545840C|nr:uncharacterized protein N7511_003872 [Penicillium nucicola]KAJ5766256.1 hypothetical protein N7511_003872 [Penicillium nucicola]